MSKPILHAEPEGSSDRVEAARLALFEHWLKIKNRAAPAMKREAGPRTTIKSLKQKRLAI
jgi:hypothetical protein